MKDRVREVQMRRERNAASSLPRNSEPKETRAQACTLAKGAVHPQIPPWEFEWDWGGGENIWQVEARPKSYVNLSLGQDLRS